MSGVSRLAMALISSNGRSTTGQMCSMTRFQSSRASCESAARAPRIASRQPARASSTSGIATARPLSSRSAVSPRISATATRRLSAGFSLATQSKAYTSSTDGSREISKLDKRHMCSRREISGCRPRNLRSSANRWRPAALLTGIQYGPRPSSSGRRNVNGSVDTAGSGCTVMTATRRITRGRSAASRRVANSPASSSASRRSADDAIRYRSTTAMSGGATPDVAAARARNASSRPARSDRTDTTTTERSWRWYEDETTSNLPIRSMAAGARSRIL